MRGVESREHHGSVSHLYKGIRFNGYPHSTKEV